MKMITVESRLSKFQFTESPIIWTPYFSLLKIVIIIIILKFSTWNRKQQNSKCYILGGVYNGWFT